MNVLFENLVFYRQYIRELPKSLILSFKADTKEKQKEIYDLYKLSLDKNILNVHLAIEGETTLIFKPDAIITKQSGFVQLITRGGSVIKANLKQFGNTPEEILNNLKDWMMVTIDRKYKIVDIEILAGHTNTETAKEILNELTPLEALIYGFGLYVTPETLRLFYPRILPLFAYDGKPIHVIQFTQPDSGKTEFAVRLETIFNFKHFTEFPSPAKLIADARTGSLGAVFTSKGITIDEFDKVNKQRFENAYDVFLTGLEQGVWRRGSQTMKAISLEGTANIPFLFFGNVLDEPNQTFEYSQNSRHEAEIIIQRRLDFNLKPFLHRIAIVDVLKEYIPITRYLLQNKDGIVGVLPDSVIRGIIKLTYKNIKMKYVNENALVQGRLRRHTEAVLNVTNALCNADVSEDTISRIVAGETDIWELFDKNKIKQDIKEEDEIREIEFNLEDVLMG